MAAAALSLRREQLPGRAKTRAGRKLGWSPGQSVAPEAVAAKPMPDADAADRKEVRRDILWCLMYVLQFELIMADADDRWRGAGGVSRVQRSVAFSHVPPPSQLTPEKFCAPPISSRSSLSAA